MEYLVKELAEAVSLVCVTVSVAVLAVGAAVAVTRYLVHWRRYGDMALKKDIWLHFAAAIILSLEFALAADIADTAVAPTWDDIGQLAAIAAIRTFLNLFLERDVEALKAGREAAAGER